MAETAPRLSKAEDILRWADQFAKYVDRVVAPRAQAKLAFVNGNNNNFTRGGASLIEITGPTLAFTITGVGAGASGDQIVLLNLTGQNMSLAHESGLSEAGNRINTSTGATVTSVGNGYAILEYNVNRWHVVSFEV